MIQTEQLLIRAPEKDDLPTLYQWNSQAFRGDYQEFAFTSMQELCRQYDAGELFGESFQMLVAERPDGEPLGLIYLSFIRTGMARLGLVLAPPARGGGNGKRITTLIAGYLFDNYPIVRIEAETDSKNIPAQKVLEASGFVREGVLRKARFHHGEYRDFVLYSAVR